MLTLITGGARSGKSSFAQSLCGSEPVTYIATATRSDDEMRLRIERHRSDRPTHWRTIEEPVAVSEAVATNSSAAGIILVDCITLWLSNLFLLWCDDDAPTIEAKASASAETFIEAATGSQLIVVTNELGSGIVPESSVARLFRDVQGFVNQRLARAASSVYLLTAGMPLRIK